MNFKLGDKVKCVDGGHGLIVGKVYTVSHAYAGPFGKPCVDLAEISETLWYASRFEPIQDSSSYRGEASQQKGETVWQSGWVTYNKPVIVEISPERDADGFYAVTIPSACTPDDQPSRDIYDWERRALRKGLQRNADQPQINVTVTGTYRYQDRRGDGISRAVERLNSPELRMGCWEWRP